MEVPKNCPGEEFFKIIRSKFWVRHFFQNKNFQADIWLFSEPVCFFNWIKKHPFKEHRCTFKIDKITCPKRRLEHRMALSKISLHYILKNCLVRVFASTESNNFYSRANWKKYVIDAETNSWIYVEIFFWEIIFSVI